MGLLEMSLGNLWLSPWNNEKKRQRLIENWKGLFALVQQHSKNV
jgi:hypothetical protein